MQTLIVFCHLRWDFVFQRPQHLMTRLARHYKVLFVEEPCLCAGPAWLERSEVAPNITVCRPHTPIEASGFHDDQLPTLAVLLAELALEEPAPIVWFYTPMALPLLRGLRPAKVVYDCMDELAAFKNAPKQLLQRESALLNIADIVFTGGPSLYQNKRERHANVHCFPSSVDANHFRQAKQRSISHPDQAHIAHPRLGFYGVIDERFDAQLVHAMAEAHPHWQIVLVGPVLKIDPASLPCLPNVHYLGQREYAELPRFLAGWDVCLLPFAINASTRYISPTKVLEYMAAELPSVSTPITDVAVPYGEVVDIAATHTQFIEACQRQLMQGAAERTRLKRRMREIVAGTSWDRTAASMHQSIQTAHAGHRAERFFTQSNEVSASASIRIAQAG